MPKPETSPFFLASITRYDVTIEESGFESCLQLQTQWAIYLTLQLVISAHGFDEHTSFQFQVIILKLNIVTLASHLKTLLLSGLLSLWSLTLGQLKVGTSHFDKI